MVYYPYKKTCTPCGTDGRNPITCTQCRSINSNNLTEDYKVITQKRIQKTVRVPGSQFSHSLAVNNVDGGSVNKVLAEYYNVNWNH